MGSDFKYVQDWGGWSSREVKSTDGCSLWRSIRTGWDIFMRHAQYMVGDGLKVWLWHDASCGRQLLKDLYSELYTIATNNDTLVVSFLEKSGHRRTCSLNISLFKTFMTGN